MTSRQISAAELVRVRELIEACLVKGAEPPASSAGPNAIEVAAAKLHEIDSRFAEVSTASRVAYLQRAIQTREPDWSLYRPAQYRHVESVSAPTGKSVTVCVIPDVHADPRLSNVRLKYMGRWAADHNPDYIVQLGDWLTLDSLSTHHDQGSIEGHLMHSFKSDLLCAEESLGLFEMGFGDKFPHLIFTEGNHEFRAHRFENSHPQLAGTIVSSLHDVFGKHGWRYVPFGEFVFIEGVGFIHHVMNAMGRPYGGKTAAQRVASDSVFSTVSGHTHQKQAADVPKIGPNKSVRAISAGCALPHGHIEGYASHNSTGWWWGCLVLRIQNGVILDEKWDSMLTIYEKYGD